MNAHNEQQGYTAADMADQAAAAFERGRESVLAEQAAAAQEAVAWMTHHDEPMLYPTFAEAAAYCDDGEPPIPLYAAPVAAAPVTVTRDADGEIVMVKQGVTIIASTCHAGGKATAAPGIDLAPFRPFIAEARNNIYAYIETIRKAGRDCSAAMEKAKETERLLDLIDASPQEASNEQE